MNARDALPPAPKKMNRLFGPALACVVAMGLSPTATAYFGYKYYDDKFGYMEVSWGGTTVTYDLLPPANRLERQLRAILPSSGTAVRFSVGYQIQPWLAVEGYGEGITTEERCGPVQYSEGSDAIAIGTCLQTEATSVGAGAVFTVPASSPVQALFRTGFSQTTLDEQGTFSVAGFPDLTRDVVISGDAAGADFHFGISIRLSPRIALRLESRHLRTETSNGELTTYDNLYFSARFGF